MSQLSANWNRPDKRRRNKFSSRNPRHPAGLRGKEIGLFYRDRQIKKEKPKEYVINLSIPPAVLTHVYTNLQLIAKIADRQNIQLSHLRSKLFKKPCVRDATPNQIVILDTKIKEEISADNIQEADLMKSNSAENLIITKSCTSVTSEFESIKEGTPPKHGFDDKQTSKPCIKMEPDVSTAPDFIPLKRENSEQFELDNTEISALKESKDVFKRPDVIIKIPETSSLDFIPITQPGTSTAKIEYPGYGSGVKQISTGGGDYKYGYEDIITGTFDEKLEQSLFENKSINVINSEVNDISAALCTELQDMFERDSYKRLMKFRQLLPAYKKSKELLDVINNNQVIVISGETGCGKSTQVPQIILDNAICNNRGANVKIFVTQPRRIAASSLAMRVAEERGETLGNSVGYAVRLEKVDARPRGSIMFCTTGILLADLEVNQGLTNYSHIILDEVHERDCHIDLSMCMLKKVLKKRSDLKLILMSATLDAERLSAYFDNCPLMHIEGLAYPVQDIYLEDILRLTKFTLIDEPPKHNARQKWNSRYGRKNKTAKVIREKDVQYKAEIAPWLESVKRNLDHDVYKTLQDSRIEELNIDLIFELLIYICKGEPGAILVFLPGIGEITKLLKQMSISNAFPSSRYEIYPLHSKLPSLEQRKIFEKPPQHVRKIIVATNIAETSITIDDIVFVVDCGKLKMSGLNVEQNIATLNVEWISQANLRQRRGRAGRCQPGVCYHLVTSYRAQKLSERLLPELQRSNLLEPVLAMKKLRLGKAAVALALVPDPPAEATVQWAVKHLQQCGALDEKETLTPLGWHLARLPVHPAAGKLLLLGALFGCLDRAASVAAVWGFKDPFHLVIGKEREVDESKRNFTLGEPSDHIAMSEAIMQWELQKSHRTRMQFAYDHFLSNHTLELLSDMKNQFADNLRQMGFLPAGDVRSAWENRNAYNMSLFKAIVAASLYPNIGTVRWLSKKTRIIVHTPEEGRLSLHPSSVMSSPRWGGNRQLCHNPGANWLVYWLKQRSSDLFLIDVTLVYTLPLLFFGEFKVIDAEEENPEECFINIHSTIKVRCRKETVELLFELRSLLDHVLASKIMPSNSFSTQHTEFEETILNTVIHLITAEDEQAEYLGEEDLTESDNSECEPNHKRWH